MAKRKTLKQKLKQQLRQTKAQAAVDREHAGITINFEMQVLQPVAMAHTFMASLLHAKKILGEDNEQYKQFEAAVRPDMTKCYAKLMQLGFTPAQVNDRIKRGY